MLHLIQLLVWGLQSGQIISMEKGRESPAKTHFLLGVAEKLLYEVEPQRAMDLLLKEGPDEGEPEETWVDLKELDKVEDPTKAALMLADALENLIRHRERSTELVNFTKTITKLWF
jgi:hypothetical protein